MSKLIIAPPLCFSPTAIHDRWTLLGEFLRKEHGFEYHKTIIDSLPGNNNRNIRIEALPSDVETIFLLTPLKFLNSEAFLGALDKQPNAKLISYVFDTHSHGEFFKGLFQRSSLILSWHDEKFRVRWPEYADKLVFFPPYFSPDERFVRHQFNEEPIMKCLVAGSTSRHYPLRRYLLREAIHGHRDILDVLHYAGVFGAEEEGAIVRNAFADKLHEYYCGATSTVLGCVICKPLEIAAVGSLLLTNRIRDFDTMGFVPYVHYIPITKENAIEVITGCIANPEKYKEVRLNGMRLVRADHSWGKRMAQLSALIKAVESW